MNLKPHQFFGASVNSSLFTIPPYSPYKWPYKRETGVIWHPFKGEFFDAQKKKLKTDGFRWGTEATRPLFFKLPFLEVS